MLALCYAIWNETTGYLIGTLLFLVHPIVCVGLQVWSDGWEIGGVLKTAVIGAASVVGSWIMGVWMVLNAPGVGEVLRNAALSQNHRFCLDVEKDRECC